MFKFAIKFFIKIIKNKELIIFSNTLIWELKKDYKITEITNFLSLFFINNNLKKINITKEEYSEAKELARERNLPFVDCLNAVQAKNYNAVLITQDKHYFEKLSDITKAFKPQQVMY